MFWLIVFLAGYATLHFVFLMQIPLAIIDAALPTVFLWILWKLKWFILGIIGLEEIFGGKSDGT